MPLFDSLGHTTCYEFKPDGRITAVMDPLGATEFTDYNVHNSSNLEIHTPWGHESVDIYRNVGYDLERVISGVDTW